jgi:hypothetical protein
VPNDVFHVQNGLKEGALSYFALEFTIRKVQAKQEVLELNETYQLLVYADDINLLGEGILTTNKYTEASLQSSEEIGLQVMHRQLTHVHVHVS